MSEKEKPSIKKNFIMNGILSLSSILFPLISFPYVSRILSPSGTGKVSFATSLVAYFLIIAQLGIPTYGVRATAKVRDNKLELSRVVHELFCLNLLMCAVAYAGFFIAIETVPRLQGDKTLYIIVSLTILLNAMGMTWLFQGLEMYSYITKRSLLFKLIALIGMFLLIRSKDDYVIYGVLTIFASSASYIVNFIYANKLVSFKNVGGYNYKRHLKAIGVFFAMTCVSTIYTNLDTVMLGFMTTDIDVGYYNAAIKIKNALVSIVTSLGAVLLPRAAYYLEHDMKEDFMRISSKAINFVCVAAIPLAVYFIIFAEPSILLVSGSAYEGSVEPMQLIMPTLFFIGMTYVTGLEMLVPMGKEKYTLYSFIAGAVTDLILNFLLIPKMASSGAAIGTLTAEFMVLVVQVYFLRQEVMPVFRKFPWWKLLIALTAGTAASVWNRFVTYSSISALDNFIELLISAVLFFGVYGAALILMKEPIAMESLYTLVSKFRRK